MSSALITAATVGTVAITLYGVHGAADHWIQTHHQAQTKGRRDNGGKWACLKHVSSYTATCTAAVVAVVALIGLPLSAAGVAAGAVVNGGSHYWADRRYTLAWLARVTGHADFWAMGTGTGSGAYAMDQSYHKLFLLVTAVVTGTVSLP